MANHSEGESNFPEPPPIRPGAFLPLAQGIHRDVGEYVWLAVRMYLDSIQLRGKPWPGWESFERDLAELFAMLLLFLKSLPKEAHRHELLNIFLDNLNLGNKPGRARKAKEQLRDFYHGQQMANLWDSELQEVWNKKASFERMSDRQRIGFNRDVPEDVLRAVRSPKATPESSLARVYSHRKHISVGRARNALRACQKQTSKKFAPQV